MVLEEGSKHISKEGKIIHLNRLLKVNELDIWLKMILYTILKDVPDPYSNEYDTFEEQAHVVIWLTNDLSMPSGYWQISTGKCLRWNTPAFGNVSKEFVEKFLAMFDIDV